MSTYIIMITNIVYVTEHPSSSIVMVYMQYVLFEISSCSVLLFYFIFSYLPSMDRLENDAVHAAERKAKKKAKKERKAARKAKRAAKKKTKNRKFARMEKKRIEKQEAEDLKLAMEQHAEKCKKQREERAKQEEAAKKEDAAKQEEKRKRAEGMKRQRMQDEEDRKARKELMALRPFKVYID